MTSLLECVCGGIILGQSFVWYEWWSPHGIVLVKTFDGIVAFVAVSFMGSCIGRLVGLYVSKRFGRKAGN